MLSVVISECYLSLSVVVVCCYQWLLSVVIGSCCLSLSMVVILYRYLWLLSVFIDVDICRINGWHVIYCYQWLLSVINSGYGLSLPAIVICRYLWLLSCRYRWLLSIVISGCCLSLSIVVIYRYLWLLSVVICGHYLVIISHRLVGLVVKASASRVEDPGFEYPCAGNFSGSSHTSDLKIGIPVATLPGAWRSRVNSGTSWPGVSIL